MTDDILLELKRIPTNEYDGVPEFMICCLPQQVTSINVVPQ
jgi:hypothetical protein